jgi:hypothetical protein
MIYTGYIPLANILKSNPKRSFSSVASQSSFASSRQASASDLLPSPAALATRAQGEGSPPRAAAAPSQRRPLLHHRCQSSRLAHVIWWLLLFSFTTRAQTRPGCVPTQEASHPARRLERRPATPRQMLPRRRQFGVGRSSTSRSPSAASATATKLSPAA